MHAVQFILSAPLNKPGITTICWRLTITHERYKRHLSLQTRSIRLALILPLPRGTDRQTDGFGHRAHRYAAGRW